MKIKTDSTLRKVTRKLKHVVSEDVLSMTTGNEVNSHLDASCSVFNAKLS